VADFSDLQPSNPLTQWAENFYNKRYENCEAIVGNKDLAERLCEIYGHRVIEDLAVRHAHWDEERQEFVLPLGDKRERVK
jgi:hypothetical protein